jgi:hypothetical protein
MSKKNSKTVKTVKVKKVNSGKVGAPQKVIKWPNGEFTLAEAVSKNPQVCKLTVVDRAKKELKFVREIKTGKVGRPSFVFMVRANVARKNTEPVVEPVTTAPVVVAETVIPVADVATVQPIVDVVAPAAPVENTPVEAAVIGGEPVLA